MEFHNPTFPSFDKCLLLKYPVESLFKVFHLFTKLYDDLNTLHIENQSFAFLIGKGTKTHLHKILPPQTISMST